MAPFDTSFPGWPLLDGPKPLGAMRSSNSSISNLSIVIVYEYCLRSRKPELAAGRYLAARTFVARVVVARIPVAGTSPTELGAIRSPALQSSEDLLGSRLWSLRLPAAALHVVAVLVAAARIAWATAPVALSGRQIVRVANAAGSNALFQFLDL